MSEIFSIKPATIDDVPTILNFIKALAEYEKLSDQITATEDILRQTLFGDKSHAEVVFGCLDEEPVAMALFFHNFSTFQGKPGIYLEDLFVYPKARGKGIGQKLLNYLGAVAKERQCGRLEWIVLDWNIEAIRFYKRLGAIGMDEWTIHRVSGKALDTLADQWHSPFNQSA